MKKYGKALIIGIVTFFVSISVAYAKESVALKDLLKEAEKINSNATDVYIIGDYAFTSGHDLTSQDIMLSARSINVGGKTGKTNTGDVYKEMVMQHFTREMDKMGKFAEWKIESPRIGTPDKKIEDLEQTVSVHYIDYNLVNDVSADVEDELKKDAESLKSSATSYGFNGITYENHTLTFDISDLNRKLVEYASSDIINMFNTIVNGKYGFTSITYIGKDGQEVTKTQKEVTNPKSLAGEMLLALSGKKDVSPSELTYLDVANKSTTATVTYTDPEYGEKEVTYTLSFTYDTKVEKDKVLKTAADELNDNVKDYGFKSVSYENETATFEIVDTTKTLFDFSKSGILDMFDKYIAGATKIEYTVGSTPVSITSVDASKKTQYAAQLLCLMANNGDNEKCVEPYSSAKGLTLGDVANKSATAKFTYTIGNETVEITYTLNFNYDLETVKNDAIQADIDALIEKIDKDKAIFSSVEYDKSTHTATFTIKNKEKQLSELGGALIDFYKMFNEFVKDSESIEYKVDEQPVSVSGGAGDIAKELLCTMAKKEVKNCSASTISLSELSGKSATATVKYKVGGKSISYTITFVADPAATASMLKFNSNNKVFRLN